MELRTYRASTMAEALVEAKRDLGPAAVIMHTRRFRKGGMLGLFGGRVMWEVRAAADVNVLPRPVKGQYLPVAPAGPDGRAPAQTGPAEQTGLMDGVNQIRRMIESLLAKGPGQGVWELPEELAAVRRELLDQDVDEPLVRQLVAELQLALSGRDVGDRKTVEARLTERIATRIKAGPVATDAGRADGPRRIVLIGPTGVGKTTTIAKLAANYKLREKKKVGLITIDTYRIAAVDQLRTYADIIEVPLEAVLSPGELHQAIRAMSSRDVVLIDTAGRSQNDELKLNDLGRFVEAAGCDEVHLVISAAGSAKVARAALDKFAPMAPNGVILTKLDEAATFGIVLNTAVRTESPITYVTTGQDVPDDIAPGRAEPLAECVVRGKWHGS